MLIFEDAKGLELSSTLDCGQCFRWLPQKEGWQGVAEGRSVLAYTKGNALILEGAEEEDREFWANYFALDLDYPALQERFCAGNRRLKLCVEENPGIRVLRQPFFETLCTFLISQNNNIARIRGIVERLCALAGEPVAYGRFSFPDPARLAGFSLQELAPLRAGWRSAYLLNAAQQADLGRRAAGAAPGSGPPAAAEPAGGGPQGGGLRASVRSGPVAGLSPGCVDQPGHGYPLPPGHPGLLPQPGRHCPAVHLCLCPGSSAPGRRKKGKEKAGLILSPRAAIL